MTFHVCITLFHVQNDKKSLKTRVSWIFCAYFVKEIKFTQFLFTFQMSIQVFADVFLLLFLFLLSFRALFATKE